MDTQVPKSQSCRSRTPLALGGLTMKKMYGKPVTLGLLSVLTVSVLFGSAAARADVVLDWNTIAVNTAVANHQNPFAQARYAAIVQLAVFKAVNAITGEYRPYLGTIVAPPGASADAAAVQAAYDVLVNYFPNSQTTLQTQLAASLALI